MLAYTGHGTFTRYNWFSFGGLELLVSGVDETVFLQGDEAHSLLALLDSLTHAVQVDSVIVEYFV